MKNFIEVTNKLNSNRRFVNISSIDFVAEKDVNQPKEAKGCSIYVNSKEIDIKEDYDLVLKLIEDAQG